MVFNFFKILLLLLSLWLLCVQLDSDKSVIGSDGSRLRSDSYVDESPADDSANNSSGVFKDNDHSQPSALSSETNNNTKRQASYLLF